MRDYSSITNAFEKSANFHFKFEIWRMDLVHTNRQKPHQRIGIHSSRFPRNCLKLRNEIREELSHGYKYSGIAMKF